jgi:hypothetical protein
MDYGEAIPRNCVVSAGVCDMGRSAIHAARNVHVRYGLPMSRIELTPMIGVNDVVSNVFTLDDARLWSGRRALLVARSRRAVRARCGSGSFAYARAFRGPR